MVASGTDYPASDAGNPIMTLYSLVTRRGPDGVPQGGWLSTQNVGVDVALRSMTQGAAYAAFQEKELGAITVGRRADFTVLSDDPYAGTRGAAVFAGVADRGRWACCVQRRKISRGRHHIGRSASVATLLLSEFTSIGRVPAGTGQIAPLI